MIVSMTFKNFPALKVAYSVYFILVSCVLFVQFCMCVSRCRLAFKRISNTAVFITMYACVLFFIGGCLFTQIFFLLYLAMFPIKERSDTQQKKCRPINRHNKRGESSDEQINSKYFSKYFRQVNILFGTLYTGIYVGNVFHTWESHKRIRYTAVIIKGKRAPQKHIQPHVAQYVNELCMSFYSRYDSGVIDSLSMYRQLANHRIYKIHDPCQSQ